MSGPRPAVIVLILLLVAVVALFIVFVGVGAIGQQTEPGWVAGLKRRFTTAKAVARQEVEACQAFSEFPPGAPCVLKVKPSDQFMRKLTLSTLDEVAIKFRPEPDAEPILIRLKPSGEKEPVSLSIRGKGAVLELECLTFQVGGTRRGCIVAIRS